MDIMVFVVTYHATETCSSDPEGSRNCRSGIDRVRCGVAVQRDRRWNWQRRFSLGPAATCVFADSKASPFEFKKWNPCCQSGVDSHVFRILVSVFALHKNCTVYCTSKFHLKLNCKLHHKSSVLHCSNDNGSRNAINIAPFMQHSCYAAS